MKKYLGLLIGLCFISFIVIGGTTYITGSQIKDSTITTADILDNTIQAADIGDSLNNEQLILLTDRASPFIIGTATDAQRVLMDSIGNITADGYGIFASYIQAIDGNIIDATPILTLYDSDVNKSGAADSSAIVINSSDNPTLDIFQSTGKYQRITYALEGWITHDAATDTITIGVLPTNAFVSDVYIWTQEAFNSDGTDQVSVGYTGAITAYATAVDVGTTGVEAVTLGATSRTVDATSRTVQAYFVPGGTAATTGEAHIVVVWMQATVNP